MPLPEPELREELHRRRIDMHGYRRQDGWYDIEGRVVDTKTQAVMREGHAEPTLAGSPLHDMWIRLVIDQDLVVRDVVAVTDASPYEVCREAASTLRVIIGARIKPGWTNMVKERLGGAKSCTHLMELLMPLATAAYQTLGPLRKSRPEAVDGTGRPLKIDSCYAYASHRSVVARRWPAFVTTAPDTSEASP